MCNWAFQIRAYALGWKRRRVRRQLFRALVWSFRCGSRFVRPRKQILSLHFGLYQCLTCLESIANGSLRVMHFNNQLLSTLFSHCLPRINLFDQEAHRFTAHVKLLPVVYNGLSINAAVILSVLSHTCQICRTVSIELKRTHIEFDPPARWTFPWRLNRPGSSPTWLTSPPARRADPCKWSTRTDQSVQSGTFRLSLKIQIVDCTHVMLGHCICRIQYLGIDSL